MKKRDTVIARVTSVFLEGGRVFVSVQEDRPGVTSDPIPFSTQSSAMLVLPRQNDLVELYEVEGGQQYARFSHAPAPYDMPDLGEGDAVFKFDESTEIRVSRNDEGDYDIRIDASGSITIGDAENVESLAIQNHTHTAPEGGGTTSTPNESGTNTKVE